MNNLQTGTPARELTPQGYKNSAQKGSVQSTLSSPDVQQSNGAVLQMPISGKLQVSTPAGQQSTLGASTVDEQPALKSAGVSYVPVALLIVSAILAAYFFKRYRRVTVAVREERDEKLDQQ